MTGREGPPAGGHVPGLFGRAAEVGVLRALLDDCLAGRGSVAIVVGEAGIGKTALVSTFAREAAAAGAAVLWGAGWAAGTPPYWIWVDAVRSGKGHEPVRAIAELLRGGGEAGGEDRFGMFVAVASMLDAAAQAQPLVVALDDLHWADSDSLQLLSFVARVAPRSRIVVVATWRSGDPSVGRLPTEDLQNAVVVPVAGLDIGAASRLLRRLTGREPDRMEVEELLGRTGGNPLFLTELGRALAERSPSATEVAPLPQLPSRARDVLRRTVRHLPLDTQRALDVVAVVGARAPVPVVAAVLGLAAPELVARIETAQHSGVLVAIDSAGSSAVAFRHALFREVLLDDLGTIERMRLHAAVAAVLDEHRGRGWDVDASELAEHHLSAGALGDLPRAVEAAVAAADHAERAMAFGEAARWLRRALGAMDRVNGDPGRRHDLLLRIGDLERRSGAITEARETLARAVRHAEERSDTEAAARAVLSLARIGLPSGLPEADRRRLFERAMSALPRGPSQARAALLAAAARDRYHANLGLPKPAASDLADEAVEMAEQIGDPWTLAFCLLAAHDVRWGPGTASDRLEIAQRVGELAGDADVELWLAAHLGRVSALLELGDPEALSALRRFVQRAESTGQPLHRYYALSRRALVAMLENRLQDADRLAREAERHAALLGERDGVQVAIAQLSEIASLDGRRRELHEERGPPPTDAMHQLGGIHHALGELATGHRDVSRRMLAPLLRTPQRLPRDYLWPQTMSLLAEAAAALDDTAAARRLYSLLTAHAGSCVVVAGAASFRGAVDHYLGVLALALGWKERGVEHLRAAVAIHERVGAQPWAARSARLLDEARGLSAGSCAVGQETLTGATQGIWRRRGRGWHVSYEGLAVDVADSKGMRDLAVLVSRPGEEIHVVELAGVRGSSRGDAVLDERAKAAYRRRLREIEEDLDEAERHNDLGRAERAGAERDALVAELSAALALGGRDRRLGDDVERARKAVSARIRDAVERINDVHPPLAAHLRASVSTGRWCAYRPVQPVAWSTAG